MNKNMKNFMYLSVLLLVCSHALAASEWGQPHNQAPAGYTHIECEIRPFARPDWERKFTHPHIPLRDGTSNNWSGYVSETNFHAPAPHAVTKVVGTWTVPLISSSIDDTYCSIWVGIDGFADGTVEQIGTEHDWSGGSQQNYAWFEMYPNYPFEIIGFPINVGDSITGTVEFIGANTYKLSLFNNTQHYSTVIPVTYTKSRVAIRSSAEWIVEAPYSDEVLPLSHFSTIEWTNCAAVIKGVNKILKNTTHESLTMVTNTDIPKATPSPLTVAGNGFSVTWSHE